MDAARRILVALAGALALAVGGAAAAAAPDVRDAVAIVVTRGTDSGNGNAEVQAQGTGFFIHPEGYLVTSYHLVSGLGKDVQPSSVEYEVYLDRNSLPLPASKVYSSEEFDLMVLYVAIGDKKVGVLRPADRNSFQVATTTVYAAGFAGGYNFSLTPGFVTALHGPVVPQVIPSWTTTFAFSGGQSGAPIVLESREVIAAVKAADSENPALGIVVPISLVPTQYWDNTAAGQRVRDTISGPQVNDPARVVVTRPTVTTAPRDRRQTLRWTRAACNPQASRSFTFYPEPGWQIDVASAVVGTRKFEGEKVDITPVVRGPGGSIVVEVELVGSDTCIFQQSIGTPATFEGFVSYSEVPMKPVTQDVVVAEAAAASDLKLPLSADVSNLSYFIVSDDGVRRELKPTPASLKTVNGSRVLDLNSLEAQIKKMGVELK